MRKIFRFMLILFFASFALITFNSCEDTGEGTGQNGQIENASIVGTWKATDLKKAFGLGSCDIIKFFENGSGIFTNYSATSSNTTTESESYGFSYVVEGSRLYFSFIATSEFIIEELTNTTLILKEADGSRRRKYTRVE
jgi:hypothetical protein